MRILIQEMKTIIRTVTENKQLSKENSNTKNSPNQETQTKPNKENPRALSFEVASITKLPQTSPYEEAIKHCTKLEKIDQPQEGGLRQQKTDLRPWKQWKWRIRPYI